jgi:hypothetical protein
MTVIITKPSAVLPLSLDQFASDLICSEDLDPVYPTLVRAELPRPQLDRWLLAYWCFYHMGTASLISEYEGEGYWKQMKIAANNEGLTWPRSSERRYFRGPKCVRWVEQLSTIDPSERIDFLTRLYTNEAVIREVSNWSGFGPWIGFKIADMLEVVLNAPIEFSMDIPLIYKKPRESLFMIAEETGDSALNVLNNLIESISRFREPGAGRRPCGVQEAETVLCKYKRHRIGFYPVGKDIAEIHHSLKGWGETAKKLLERAPEKYEA